MQIPLNLFNDYVSVRGDFLNVVLGLSNNMVTDTFRGAMYGVAFLLLVWAFILRIKDASRDGSNIMMVVGTMFAFIVAVGATQTALYYNPGGASPGSSSGWFIRIFEEIGKSLSGSAASSGPFDYSDALLVKVRQAVAHFNHVNSTWFSLEHLFNWSLGMSIVIAVLCIILMDIITVVLLGMQSLGIVFLCAIIPAGIAAMAMPGGVIGSMSSIGWGWLIALCQLLLWFVAFGIVGHILQAVASTLGGAFYSDTTVSNSMNGMLICVMVAVMAGMGSFLYISATKIIGRLLPGGNAAAGGLMGNIVSAPVQIVGGGAKVAAGAAAGAATTTLAIKSGGASLAAQGAMGAAKGAAKSARNL